MKRMSEIFKLPVEVNQVYVSPNLIEYGKVDDAAIRDVLIHAAHAINHVDALADALEDICALNEEIGIPVKSAFVYLNAAKALAAYRGGK